MKKCAECHTVSDDAAPWCASCGGASWEPAAEPSAKADEPAAEPSAAEPAPSRRGGKGGR